MLTWDDEVKPTPQANFHRGPSGSRMGEAPSAVSALQPQLRTLDDGAVVAPKVSRPSAPAPANLPAAPAKRVNAADKRIINGQTDVNQLVPLNTSGPGKNIWPAVPTIGCRKKST